MPNELRRIEDLLAEHIGLDPLSVSSRLILRAAQHRMNELLLENLSDYQRLLSSSRQEMRSLAEQVVVPESWFFRDSRPYQWLRTFVRVHWLTLPPRPSVRVLSLGCAGGEEPYSIAMTMVDLGLAASRFQIDAVDISSRRLAMARQGIYSATAFRGSDLDYRSRFFRKHPQGFEIDPAIRSMVRFLEGNVLDPQLLEGVPAYDVIFCRNLLIYLHPIARASVTRLVERLLTADGLVVVGHADRFEWNRTQPKFTPVGEPGYFVHARSVSSLAREAEPEGEPFQVATASVAGETSTESPALMASGIRRIPQPASTAGPSASSVPTSESESLLNHAALLANQGRHAEAVATCERAIQLRGPTSAAYYLLGMIHQSQGDHRQAEVCFQKTVYLDPSHDEALLALALLAERRGERKAAQNFRRRAARTSAVTRYKAT
jgi:chemotaxis protein methyltransferase WspC